MTALTQTGTLPIGLVIDGVRHQEFELRPPTVGDNVDASLESVDGTPLEMSTGVYARQLIRLGTLDAKKIDASLLMQLNPMDWNALEQADTELRKKLMRDGQEISGGQPLAQLSPATA